MIDAPIGRHRFARERMAVADGDRGRHAVTHWRVEEALGAAAWLSCRLETGRTHQIRVHLAHIGHPLIGDSVYGAGFKTKANRLGEPARQALAALNRQALHAGTLGFEHPVTSDSLYLERSPPRDFMNLAGALRV
jgi:23S rRNA pseudouridine1911/1915/1917 synthase